MRTSTVTRTMLLILALLLAVVACRRGEEETPTPTLPPAPTVAPTAAPTEAATEAVEPTEEAAPPLPAGAVDPKDIDWAPQVVDVSPPPGAEAGTTEPLTVRFDQPMDQASVEAAFSVEPTVDGKIDWSDAQTLVFTPAEPLEQGKSYGVRVANTAASLNGLALPEAVEIDWQTVGPLVATQFGPADSAVGVPLDAIITVAFNQPVVPLVSTGDQASLPQPLTIEPAVAGRGEWISTSIYRYIPETSLAGGTRYSVTVDSALQTFGGATLASAPSWQFTTLSPEVVSVVPENDATGINPTGTISITFSAPMDRAATEAATSLSGPGGAVAVEFNWADGDHVLGITPSERLELESNYTVSVSTGAAAAAGGAAMATSWQSTFATVRFPAVDSVNPPDGSRADQWQRGFNVSFVSPMNPETIEDKLIIEPMPKDVDYFYSEWEGASSVYVDFALEPNVQYRVTVPADAADPYGNTLGEAFTWSFTAPPYQPVASFNLPREVAQLSTSFPTTVEVIHRNVSSFTVDLYAQALDVALLFNTYSIIENPPADPPLREFTVTPTTNKDEAGVTAVQLADGGVLPSGIYRLSVTAPEVDSDNRYWLNQNVFIVVGDTNMVVKEMFGKVHVWATDLATGQPAAGRNLTFYRRNGEVVGTAVSDASGFASVDYEPYEMYLDGVMVVSNEAGQAGFGVASSHWNGNASMWSLGVNADSSRETPTFVYMYTDRPIYRPGDTVYYKGIVRQSGYGRYSAPTIDELEVAVGPQFYSEQTTEERFTVQLDETGAFSGEYVLAEGMQLGSYQFYVPSEYYGSYRAFTVAEYRKPEFSVTLTPEVAEALRGETVDVTLEAVYLFGAPASNLMVNWTIYEKDFWPQIDTKPPFAFGDTAGFNYVDYGPFGNSGTGGDLGRYAIGGSGETDAQGRLVITVPADVLKETDNGSRTITVEATVGGVEEFPISARTSLVLHAAETYVGIRSTDYIYDAGDEATFELLSTDWYGEPVPNAPVEVVFYQREWEYERVVDYGMYQTRWTPVDTEVARQTLTTDGEGKASVSFVPETGGTYLAVATVTDSGGREQFSSTAIYVVDPGYYGWRTDPNKRTMDLTLDKKEYRVGETARVLVQSPFAQPVQAWLTLERGALLEQRVITVQAGQPIDIPITADMAPNVHLVITAIKPVDSDPDFPYADIRLGVVEIVVDPEQLTLDVVLSPAQTSYAPGGTATFDIKVTDYLGNPVSADVSLSLVDLAVLLLKEDNAPPIDDAFYARQPLRSQLGSGLFITGEGLEPEVPLSAGGFGGGGGGEMAMEAARLPEEEDDGVRQDFKDTAYWEASLAVNGSATVDIPLPDNLTTWRLSSKAVADGTLVGQGSTDIQVLLPLQVRPLTPRFFTVGDTLRLGANVDNNTDQAIEATVTLQATGLTIDGEADQTVSVPARGRVFVTWNVNIQDVQFADLTFRVEGGGYKDASKPTIGSTVDGLLPVYRYNGRDFVATAGELDEAGRRVEAIVLPQGVDPSQGQVTVSLQPTLAAAMLESLEAVTDPSPYESNCANTYADRILMNMATQKTISELQLEQQAMLDEIRGQTIIDVSRLQALVLADGSWGWCYSDESDPWLSAFSLLALTKAQDQGYEVDGTIVSRAAGYLESQLLTDKEIGTAHEANRQAFFLYVLAAADKFPADVTDSLIAEHRHLLDPYAKALLALTYELARAQGPNQAAMLSDLNDSVIMSATGAHWEDAETDWLNLSSDIRGTAMVISALAQLEPDSTLLPPAVRWLMVARKAQTWATSHETAWAITGLSDWMAASGELEADYAYQLNVNLQQQTAGTFTAENLIGGEEVEVPVGDMAAEGLNYFDFQRQAGPGRLYYTMQLDSAIAVDKIDPVSRGMTVSRQYFDAACDPETETCAPISQIAAGQRIRAEVTVILPEDRIFVIVEDPIPAGAEAIDPNLATSASDAGGSIVPAEGDYGYGWWGWWYFDHIEYGDEKVVFLSQFLPAGTYQYTYFLDTVFPGTFQVMPTTAREQFFPEVFGRSEGNLFTINAE